MRTRAFLAVNGIKVPPGDPRNWNARFCPWAENPRNGVSQRLGRIITADRFEYHSTALTRSLFGRQDERAELLAMKMDDLAWADELTIAAHSNGAEVVMRALAIRPHARVHNLHLFAPACEASFEANGLNAALVSGRVGRVDVHRAGSDFWMKVGAVSRIPTAPLRWLGFRAGYGTLGKDGPTDVADGLWGRVLADWVYDGFGHSAFWDAEHQVESFRTITGC